MAKTVLRGYQIGITEVKQVNVKDGYMDLNTAQSISGAKTFNNAIFTATPVELASVNGVITLTDESNCFIVTGTEDVTSITGWTQGEVTILWGNSRKIIGSEDLVVQGGEYRDVATNDIHKFIFLSDTLVREVAYLALNPASDASAYVTEATASEGQTEFIMVTEPSHKSFMTVSINGIIQHSNNFNFTQNILTLTSPCNAGDEVRVFAITRALGYGVGGDFIIDGGTF